MIFCWTGWCVSLSGLQSNYRSATNCIPLWVTHVTSNRFQTQAFWLNHWFQIELRSSELHGIGINSMQLEIWQLIGWTVAFDARELEKAEILTRRYLKRNGLHHILHLPCDNPHHQQSYHVVFFTSSTDRIPTLMIATNCSTLNQFQSLFFYGNCWAQSANWLLAIDKCERLKTNKI